LEQRTPGFDPVLELLFPLTWVVDFVTA
jgi:hypothetical protein